MITETCDNCGNKHIFILPARKYGENFNICFSCVLSIAKFSSHQPQLDIEKIESLRRAVTRARRLSKL